MDNILTLNTYNKYKQLFDDGLIMVPDNTLTDTITDIWNAYREKPFMRMNETHEVMLKAGKKVRITSRGSLRDIEIDGITYDRAEQAACNIYDPYDEYIDVYHVIRQNIFEFTFIPILDPKYDDLRYTISKYSKGLSKYFDPHKVVKAVYTIDNILFYVKDNNDILRKYYFRIGSFSLNDLMDRVCYGITQKKDFNQEFYLAFFIHEEELPFTIGGSKADFYALKDILNRISFKGTTPLKYLVFKELSNKEYKTIKSKEKVVFNYAMMLSNKTKTSLCNQLDISEESYDDMIENDKTEIINNNGKTVNRNLITKFLNITDNILELKYYERLNLIWKVKYEDIPDEI